LLPLTKAFTPTLFFEPIPPFSLSLLLSPMKVVFGIKTEAVTQAGIIVAIIAFLFSLLALITTYS
jgi:hypothetical protein